MHRLAGWCLVAWWQKLSQFQMSEASWSELKWVWLCLTWWIASQKGTLLPSYIGTEWWHWVQIMKFVKLFHRYFCRQMRNTVIATDEDIFQVKSNVRKLRACNFNLAAGKVNPLLPQTVLHNSSCILKHILSPHVPLNTSSNLNVDLQIYSSFKII